MKQIKAVGEIITEMFLHNKTKLTDSYWKRENLTASDEQNKKERIKKWTLL